MNAVARLAGRQAALLDALWARPNEADGTTGFGQRALDVYRANARAHAEQALVHAYPVVHALVGDEGHAALAHRLWCTHPPQRGDLALWGGDLATCIDHLPDGAGLPYLSDVARVEWALHEAAGAADRAPALHTLARLASEDPIRLGLRLAPGTALRVSPWPVVSIVQAHTDQAPTLAECGERLRAGVAETALVWRAGWRPCVRAVDAAEAAWLRALLRGDAVGTALDDALAVGAFDIGAWLARSVQDGLLMEVIDVTTSPESSPP